MRLVFIMLTHISIFVNGFSRFNVNTFGKKSFSSNTKYDIFRYGSKARKQFKIHKGYVGFVEDHHCIPKQWRYHQLIERLDFDINCSDNIVIMPNKKAKYELDLNPNTLIHEDGHREYNKYVKYNLDNLILKPYEESRYDFWLFLHHLKFNMKYNDDNIPWN